MELSDTEVPESIQPFTVAVADEVLTDLHERLRRRRMPEDPANEDWSYGTNRAYLDELLDYGSTTSTGAGRSGPSTHGPITRR
jgi:hypothetical protein